MKVKINSNEFNMMFGHDTEFFIQNADGKVIPASRFLPGLKTNPFVLPDGLGVCHPDGCSVEIGSPPADTPAGMFKNLFKTLEYVKKYFPEGSSILPSHRIPVADIVDPARTDLEYGCSYEYLVSVSLPLYESLHRANPVEMRKCQYTDHPKVRENRFSGFHIHLGFTSGQEETSFTVIDMAHLANALDRVGSFLGLKDCEDRSLIYGGEGAFRVKPYGIEYRRFDVSVLLDPDKFLRVLLMLENIQAIIDILFGKGCPAGVATEINRQINEFKGGMNVQA